MPAAAARDLPRIAEKAGDLEAIKKAVDDAASVGGGLWLSYLFVLFYLAVAAGAVTHEDLFFEKPVKLPFLNIELPLLAFFFLAPLLFLVVHAYALVHLVILTEKAKRYHEALHNPERNVTDRARENLQWQLPSNIFIQFLAGPPKICGGLFGMSLRAIAWITLVIAPILLLLMMQVQFLPFHSSFVTWAQRIALFVDLVLLAWLWRKVLSGRELGGPFRASWAWPVRGFALSLGVLLFSWTVATFPGEWQEERLATWRSALASQASKQADDKSSEPQRISLAATFRNRAAPFGNWLLTKEASLHDRIFNSEVNDTTRRRWLPFSSTLVLPGLNVYEGLGIDDPEKIKGRDFVFRARGRDLKGAIFDLASLPKVDFTGAQLQGAFLYEAQLQGAFLYHAQLQGASLVAARLQGASLKGAQLQGASLDGAQLQEASLVDTQLQGASLNCAPLPGANIDCVQLQGASLLYAQLQGASLYGAQLEGASLEGAQLQGAWLLDTQLEGASLVGAQLQGASLVGAQLQGASFVGAQLQGASFERAVLEATDLSDAYLWRADHTPPPSVSAVRISGGDKTWLPLWPDSPEHEQPWDDKAYQALRTTIESLVPAGPSRDEALKRIQSLDCASSDEALASCDPKAWLAPLRKPPPEAEAWRKALEVARDKDTDYAVALAKALKDLVCSGDKDAIHVLRGGGFQAGLGAAGPAASDLIDDLTNKDSKDCPVSASLTDADRAKLLRIKQAIEAAKKPRG